MQRFKHAAATLCNLDLIQFYYHYYSKCEGNDFQFHTWLSILEAFMHDVDVAIVVPSSNRNTVQIWLPTNDPHNVPQHARRTKRCAQSYCSMEILKLC
jgi:hypothetical protein